MVPTRIGQEINCGTFTGFNRIGDCVYGIIVAPKSTEVELELKTSDTPSNNTRSTVDGLTNTNAMNDSDHPAAFYCKALTVNGFNNWYLPSKNELELSYRYLKPSCDENYTYTINWFKCKMLSVNGTNLSSIPAGIPYTKTSPTQTIVTNFSVESKDAFADRYYWASTESSTNTTNSLGPSYFDGPQYGENKIITEMARCVCRVLVASVS